MKKILIGMTLLTSLSSFANPATCTYSLVSNEMSLEGMNTKMSGDLSSYSKVVINELSNKGYELSEKNPMFELSYTIGFITRKKQIDVNVYSAKEHYVGAINLKSLNQENINITKSSDKYSVHNLFEGRKWQARLVESIQKLPHCFEL